MKLALNSSSKFIQTISSQASKPLLFKKNQSNIKILKLFQKLRYYRNHNYASISALITKKIKQNRNNSRLRKR
jgi:hypothetical protein